MKNSNLLPPALYDYLLDVSLRESDSLNALRKETAMLSLANMQVSPEQAQFMQFLIRSLNAKYVLELGTFTGYSALAMAMALPDDGQLITCDISPEWTAYAAPFWEKAGQAHKIQLRIAPALTTLDALLHEGYAQHFDFIFIDADKTNYCAYYERARELIRAGGIIAIDNIFWDGHVIDEQDTSSQTREIRRLNTLIKNDLSVDISLLPLADGLFLIRPRD